MFSLNKIFSRRKRNTSRSQNSNAEPIIVPSSQHTISRSQISPAALKVLYHLKDAGFEAYLVGGCVRDLLLGHEPKDFDVATNASPEQVNQLFKRSRLIGRRFKLVHVRYGREVIEVATFRAPPEVEQHVDDQGRIVRDNVVGTIHTDANRRDFTINALYTTLDYQTILDPTGQGLQDIKTRTLRFIGKPKTRIEEDPLRVYRFYRLLHTKNLVPHPASLRAVRQLFNYATSTVSPERIRSELERTIGLWVKYTTPVTGT